VGESCRNRAKSAGIMKRGAAAIFAAALIFVLAPAAALAAQGLKTESEFGAGALSTQTGKDAVDNGTGDILVVDRGRNAVAKVLIFEPSPATPQLVGEFGAGELVNPYGIAVDQSTHDVYVSDSGTEQITRYTRTTTSPPTYALDSSYQGPVAGSASGQVGNFEAALAVDPSNGDLLVADRGNRRVSRYSSAGAFLSSFDGSDSASGVFAKPFDLSIEPDGTVDVLDLEGIQEFGAPSGPSRITRFEASGSAVETLPPSASELAVAIGFDEATENLLLVREPGFSEGEPSLLEVHGGHVIRSLPFMSNLTVANGIASASAGDTYVITQPIIEGFFGGASAVEAFGVVTYPDVTISPAVVDGPRSATFSGTVNPEGVSARYEFEVSADGGANWSAAVQGDVPEENGVVATTPVAVSGQTTSLVPNQNYLVRLRAENDIVQTFSGTVSFKTITAPPFVETLDASAITASRAELHGTVDPSGLQARYWFEYGPTEAYGSRAPATHDEVVGNGHGPSPASIVVEGLQAGMTYHFRLVAVNDAGTSYGADRTFTAAADGADRAYELVSTGDESNVLVETYNETGLATPDGDSMMFSTQGGAFPGSNSARLTARYRATRSADGWHVIQTDAPTSTPELISPLFSTIAISEDQTRALVMSYDALAPPAIDGQNNLYLRDLATDTYRYIGKLASDNAQTNAKEVFVGGSSDLRTVVFYSPLANASEGGGGQFFRWEEGQGTSLLSKLPNDEPFKAAVQQVNPGDSEPNFVSRDGTTTYFSGTGTEDGESGAYIAESGSPVRAISVSHVPGGSQEVVPAVVLGASPSGRFVVFVDESPTPTPLTLEAPAAAIHTAYRYDKKTGDLTYIGENVGSQTLVRVAPEAGRIYYQDFNTLQYMTAAAGVSEPVIDGQALPEPAMSESGRYLVYASTTDQTPFEAHGLSEIYRYDAVANQTICLSCRADGRPPLGQSTIGQKAGSVDSTFQFHFPRAVNNDGTAYFDTAEPLSPNDVNGTSDVYEYRGSQVHLVSTGDTNTKSTFLEATANGSDVFFITRESLVPEDQDGLPDLYDARVGGGFSESSPRAEECTGEACRGSAGQEPPSIRASSETLRPAPSSKRPHKKKSKAQRVCHARKHKGKSTGSPRQCKRRKHARKSKGAHS
jgi:hypothetical protein